jgi:hypothetical protein
MPDDPLREHVDDEGEVDEPAQVRQQVKSATQRMSGAGAVKSRSQQIPARRPSLAGTVVARALAAAHPVHATLK